MKDMLKMMPIRVIAVILCSLILIFGPLCHGAVSSDLLLGCHVGLYFLPVYKPYKTDDGRILQCYGRVPVRICKGTCDSYELGDYKMPYTISHHPVCTYKAVSEPRTVTLENCHPDHPDPTYKVFDATQCECSVCEPKYTSCENYNG
ncbi:hypothetical protein CHS0354_029084 [Potamilus streckersoni]|uniref:Glycoprotein hormone subunit beta domain-containing protein n=1 Tax=Potamilus streckersoni TaxID=2493646 RepID=A0AAE0SXB2_9BIVA|nr:hypothetical protein CHS0354_029084 [Potamilus streckersoni]